MNIHEIIGEFVKELEAKNKNIPIDTGLRDRDGNPIMVGDYVFYHHQLTRKLGEDEDINEFPDSMVCGSGNKGYIYTGKTRRIRGRVTYNMKTGVSLNLNGRYQWDRWIDSNGNLSRVEKVSRDKFLRFGGDMVPMHFFSQ